MRIPATDLQSRDMGKGPIPMRDCGWTHVQRIQERDGIGCDFFCHSWLHKHWVLELLSDWRAISGEFGGDDGWRYGVLWGSGAFQLGRCQIDKDVCAIANEACYMV